MRHFFIIMIIALCSGSTWTMQGNEPNVAIKQWTDVAQFAGKIVAYTTSHYRFGLEVGYHINPKNVNLKFGYITRKADEFNTGYAMEKGYSIFQILTPKEAECTNAKNVVNYNLQDAEIHMRLANSSEKIAILRALKNKSAALSCSWDQIIVIDALESDKEVQPQWKKQE